MSESFTLREINDYINSHNTGPKFDPYGIEELSSRLRATQAEGGDIFAQAEQEVAADKAKILTPEQKIAEAKAQIEAMRQWLIQDGTYKPNVVDNRTRDLNVEYDSDSDQAVVQGNLDLYSLTSAEGLTLPQTIGGDLYLNSLTSAEGLSLPQTIGGSLRLRSVTSAEGLTLPQTIGGDIYLNSLTSAEGLSLPQNIGGGLGLSSLTSTDKQKLRELRPDLADKII